MTPIIIGNSVRGASHIQHNIERQDSFLIIDGIHKTNRKNKYYDQIPENVKVIAVADGHGSDACPYSKNGSQIAANIFCDIMAEYAVKYKDDIYMLYNKFSQEVETERIAKSIVKFWEERVLQMHQREGRNIVYKDDNIPDANAIWKMYGSTLLGMMITEKFIFALQLGDGDINYVDENGVSPVIEGDKILGVETHSISKPSSWKKVLTKVISIENTIDKPCMYVLSTDGFVNSHSSEEEFHKTCLDYLSMIQQHGPETVDVNIPAWLSETSEKGCGDDITVICAYFGKE